MKNNTLKLISILLVFIIATCSFASCKNDSQGNDSSSSDPTSKSLDERKEIAEEAVAEYINDFMRKYNKTGKYSVIDYDKMRYSASSTVDGNKFTVKIDIYHYNSNGELVGKNKSTIKASAEVDEYGNVSNVEALNFAPVEWE